MHACMHAGIVIPWCWVLTWGIYTSGSFARIHTYVLAYIHTAYCKHACIHTYTLAHIHLQFPPNCRGRPLMLHSLGDRTSGWGMGSMVHELSLALASAYAQNRWFVTQSVYAYTPASWWFACVVACVCMRVYWNMHVCDPSCFRSHKCMYAYAIPHTHTHRNLYMHTKTRTHPSLHTYEHTYIYSVLHTYTLHTYIHSERLYFRATISGGTPIPRAPHRGSDAISSRYRHAGKAILRM